MAPSLQNSPLRPRTVWFAGDLRDDSLAPLIGELASRARLRMWPSVKEMTGHIAACNEHAALLMAPSRGDITAIRDLQEKASPRTIALLTGTWNDGILAKQKLADGVERFRWNERDRLWNWLASHDPSRPDSSRGIQPPESTLAPRSGLVLLDGFRAADAEALLDLCGTMGLAAVRAGDARTLMTAPAAIVWHAAGLTEANVARLRAIQTRRAHARIIALVDSLRPHERRNLLSLGCWEILPWPCGLAELESCLTLLERPSHRLLAA
jgi:hypothetical protein